MILAKFEQNEVLDPEAVAERLGLGVSDVLRAIESGQLRYTPIGQNYLISGGNVLAWLQRESQPRLPRS